MSWRFTTVLLVALGVLIAKGHASPAGEGQQRHTKHQAARASHPVTERDDLSHYLKRPSPDYVGWSYVHHSPGRWIYFGPSYTFVPGRGIADEACNLPTSACPNSQRDGQ
jgi:hypothetical protein